MTHAVLDPDLKIFVAGHRGMVGSAIVRKLTECGHRNILVRSRTEVDLLDASAVRTFFETKRPDIVVLAAAKVGGILANSTYPADFIYQNLMIEANVIHEAWKAGIERLLFLGSSCIYPRNAEQPIREEALLSGYLEPTNKAYAVAKISGIVLCESYNLQYGCRYRCVMPTNLYGPNDNYDLMHSHVLPAMIRKFHLGRLALEGNWKAIERDEATFGAIPDDVRSGLKAEGGANILLWGTGSPRREFLYVDDLADACLFVLGIPDDVWDEQITSQAVTHVNIGAGEDVSIRELAEMVRDVVGFEGDIVWDSGKPDGMPRKWLDVSRMNRLGWRPKIDLKRGIEMTYRQYLTTAGYR
uniref:GDP-L-fucose synthase n=1 Tax=Desulfatirhabdium butyrativorans TaxID=340467 RepID=A0A7C4RSV0_9BACT